MVLLHAVTGVEGDAVLGGKCMKDEKICQVKRQGHARGQRSVRVIIQKRFVLMALVVAVLGGAGPRGSLLHAGATETDGVGAGGSGSDSELMQYEIDSLRLLNAKYAEEREASEAKAQEYAQQRQDAERMLLEKEESLNVVKEEAAAGLTILSYESEKKLSELQAESEAALKQYKKKAAAEIANLSLDAKKKISALQSEGSIALAEKEREVEQLKADLAEVEAELEEYRTEAAVKVANMSLESEKQLSALESEHGNALAEKENAIIELEAQLAESQSALDAYKKQASEELASVRLESKKQLSAMKSENATAVAEKERELSDLSAQLAESNSALRKCREDAAKEIKKLRENSEALLEEANAKLEETAAVAKEKEERILRESGEHESALAAEKKQKADSDANFRKDIVELQKQMSSLQDEKAEMMRVKNSLEEDHNKLKGEMSKTLKKLSELKLFEAEINKSYGVRIESFLTESASHAKELASRSARAVKETFPVAQEKLASATVGLNDGAAKLYNSSSLFVDKVKESLGSMGVPSLNTSFDMAAVMRRASSAVESMNISEISSSAAEFITSKVNLTAATSFLRSVVAEENVAGFFAKVRDACAWAQAGVVGAAAGFAQSDTTRALAREFVLYTMILKNMISDAMGANPLTEPYAQYATGITIAMYGVIICVVLFAVLLMLRMCFGSRRQGRAASVSEQAPSSASERPNQSNRYAVPPSPTESTATKKGGRQSKRS